jgi:hypothetical protein
MSDPRKREFVVDWNGFCWHGYCPQERGVFVLGYSAAQVLRDTQKLVTAEKLMEISRKVLG